VNDLDTRLGRLAAEATRDTVVPELAAIARRGRRRRRRQLAGGALVVAAVAAGLVLPARLGGRPVPVPAAAPAIDAAGADRLGGYWFARTDASVFLQEDATPAQRQAIRRRIESLEVVDRIWFESRAEAYARLKAMYRTKPQVVDKASPVLLPESFRVRLKAPEHFQRLQQALCLHPPKKPLGYQPCMDGIEAVLEDKAPLKPVLVPKGWAAASDVTVFLPSDDPAEVRAVRARLAAIDGVARVTYQSPEEAYRRLPEKLRRDGADPAKVTPLYSPETMPAAFHVALDRPARVEAFHRALCGSRTTGECAGGLVVLEHPRRR
jgi:cell division protein FtsX